MFILHLALGGCLKAPPICYGLTADTGGHIAYVIEAAQAQASHVGVRHVSIVTRRFDDPRLGTAHALACEPLAAAVTIDRIDSGDRRYLEKEALAADLPAFTAAFCAHLAALPALPDVIHAHFADAAAVALAARARFGIPFVYTPHALGIDKRREAGAGDALDARIDAERTAIAQAQAIIVSTRDEAERQIGGYGIADAVARSHCLPPGVPRPGRGDGSPAIAALDHALADPAKPIVLAIARPVHKKNLAALIRGYLATPALMDRANLVILAGQHRRGTSSAEERAVLAELLGLADDPRGRGRIVLPVDHDGGDVRALYARAAAGGVFVNPALHEPFGLTLIEAAAAGVPVVATRHGGPADILAATGHGLLVDPHDDTAIAAACLRIVSDPALHHRFAAAGRANAHHYSWPRYARRSVALYAALRPAPRLLASDIDNTLTGCAAGADAFAQWHARGGLPFVVATGRSFEAARGVLAQWRLPQPDAFIVDVGTRIMLRAADGDWRECADYAALLDRDWQRDAVLAALAPLQLTPQPPETERRHKISYFGTAAQAEAIRATLADAALPARVVFSHDRLIDVLAPRGGKAAAIARYAARHGWTLADCIAAGDSGNDHDMLAACGHAIVVGNAAAELDSLPARHGLMRVAAHHAGGVMEGLARAGIATA